MYGWACIAIYCYVLLNRAPITAGSSIPLAGTKAEYNVFFYVFMHFIQKKIIFACVNKTKAWFYFVLKLMIR